MTLIPQASAHDHVPVACAVGAIRAAKCKFRQTVFTNLCHHPSRARRAGHMQEVLLLAADGA